METETGRYLQLHRIDEHTVVMVKSTSTGQVEEVVTGNPNEIINEALKCNKKMDSQCDIYMPNVRHSR